MDGGADTTIAPTITGRRRARKPHWLDPVRALDRGERLLLAGLLIAGVAALAALAPRVEPAWRDLAILTATAMGTRPAPDGIVVVGIDEASLAALDEPLSLAHRTFGRALTALANARPRAVGLDLVLPDRAFETLAPGSDRALIEGLLALRAVAPVVVAATARADGTVRRVHEPLLAAAGRTGLALLPEDRDGVVRRYDDRLGAGGEAVPTFTGELAQALGITPRNGGIQYTLGEGFAFLSFAQLAAAGRAPEGLIGKIVLIGVVLPFEDRLHQPVALVQPPFGREWPGVFVHAQILRSQLADAMVKPMPWLVTVLLSALGLVPLLFASAAARTLALLAVTVAAVAAAAYAYRAGFGVTYSGVVYVAVVSLLLRGALEALSTRRDRERLRELFGGYVSPDVMQGLLAGRLPANTRGTRRTLAFLFADIRNFTTLSATRPPEEIVALLNRYYVVVTRALHSHHGTIDNFRGDGVMAIFNAPNTIDNPANAAVAAARAIFARLERLNRKLVAEGRPALAIGVSLALGDAVVGNIGAPERYNYTAIGDAANVAARIQELTKTSGMPLVATRALVARATGALAEGWTSLGAVDVRGRAREEVLGWRPATME